MLGCAGKTVPPAASIFDAPHLTPSTAISKADLLALLQRQMPADLIDRKQVMTVKSRQPSIQISPANDDDQKGKIKLQCDDFEVTLPGHPGEFGLRAVYDGNSFGLIEDDCGPGHFVKRDKDGNRLFSKRFGNHAHSKGLLATHKEWLCVTEFEAKHADEKGKEVVVGKVHIFDWQTGDKIEELLMPVTQFDWLAISGDEEHLYVAFNANVFRRYPLPPAPKRSGDAP